MISSSKNEGDFPMKSILDTVMIILFVLFMVFLIRGFMLQSAQKRRDRLRNKEE